MIGIVTFYSFFTLSMRPIVLMTNLKVLLINLYVDLYINKKYLK